MGFAKDAFVKVVDTDGNYHYGYIQEITEKGFHFLICLHEEGDSAIEYEAACGAIVEDWDKLLSDTEKKIVPLLAQNLSTKEVGAELSVSPITIRAHIRTLRLKLGLDNRQQLIAFAQALDRRLREEEN